MAAQKLCVRNKFGYCKFNQACIFKHNDKLCEKSKCDENVKKGILKYVGGTQITTDANSVTVLTNMLKCKVQSTF